MASEVLRNIARDFSQVQPAIDEATELIAALKEAGEPTADLEAELRALKIRQKKWETMLRARNLLH